MTMHVTIPAFWRRPLAALLGLASLVFLLQGSWIQGKAVLAQVLLQHAWQQSLHDGAAHRPWPWADFWPVARLRAPTHGVDLIVLEGESGQVMAFGPGHNPRSGLPATERTVVISGHRDTHFRFLKDLQPRDPLQIETAHHRYHYLIESTQVVDARVTRLRPSDDQRLLLVTCYPFDTLEVGGPLRYLVKARKVEAANNANWM